MCHKDIQMEQNLLTKAAIGDSEAQYLLGLSYCIRYIPQQAYYWLKKSAKQGNKKAKTLLNELKAKNLICHTK
jgi:TPR repeat protein